MCRAVYNNCGQPASPSLLCKANQKRKKPPANQRGEAQSGGDQEKKPNERPSVGLIRLSEMCNYGLYTLLRGLAKREKASREGRKSKKKSNHVFYFQSEEQALSLSPDARVRNTGTQGRLELTFGLGVIPHSLLDGTRRMVMNSHIPRYAEHWAAGECFIPVN